MMTTTASLGLNPNVTIGFRVPHEVFDGDIVGLRACVAKAEQLGISRLNVGDHVTFHNGTGFDGLVQSTALAATSERAIIQTSVYLLPLRHPVTVARQVASLVQMVPGRFSFGVGIGGEDPNEVLACGVDPKRLGRRMNEALPIVRALLDGETVDLDGEFFTLRDVKLRPVPRVRVPIVVGGRSAAALARAGRLADGWLGLWSTPDRWASSVEAVHAAADAAGRTGVEWQDGLTVWCGFGQTKAIARPLLAKAMEGIYRTPFEKFERYAAFGTPEDVADGLRPFVAAGCSRLNLIPNAATPDEALEGTADVQALLNS